MSTEPKIQICVDVTPADDSDLPDFPSNAAAQRYIERLMTKHKLRGLIWGEIDLRARIDEVLDEHEATFILPEGVTRDDVVKKALEMPSWDKDRWCDSSNEQWLMMADAADEAFHALGAEEVDRSSVA